MLVAVVLHSDAVGRLEMGGVGKIRNGAHITDSRVRSGPLRVRRRTPCLSLSFGLARLGEFYFLSKTDGHWRHLVVLVSKLLDRTVGAPVLSRYDPGH